MNSPRRTPALSRKIPYKLSSSAILLQIYNTFCIMIESRRKKKAFTGRSREVKPLVEGFSVWNANLLPHYSCFPITCTCWKTIVQASSTYFLSASLFLLPFQVRGTKLVCQKQHHFRRQPGNSSKSFALKRSLQHVLTRSKTMMSDVWILLCSQR